MIKVRALIGLFALLIVMSAAWLTFSYQQFIASPLSIKQSTELEIVPGETAIGLINDLVGKGWLNNRWQARVAIRLNPEWSKIKTGLYEIEPGIRLPELFALLIEGRQRQFEFTVIEGLTIGAVIAQIVQHPRLDTKQIQSMSIAQIMQLAEITFAHPEGALFADTYHFPAGYSAIELIRRSHQRLLDVLNEEWQSASNNLPYDSPYQALIMASIIEKETGVPEERDRISGVFIRRIEKGMRLQTDPTVIYGIGESYDGNIRRKDLRTDTPYNTYTRHGLPPTPIAVVGREAIYAALHPKDGSELYFVARGDGTHQFSDTLEQHNQAVRRYQLKKK